MSESMQETTTISKTKSGPSTGIIVAFSILVIAFVIQNWTSLSWVVGQWYSSDDYFYGFFVIPFALFLAWDRREMALDPTTKFQGSWFGLIFIMAATALNWWAAYDYYIAIEAITITPAVFGLVLLIGGGKAVRWLWPSVLFLAMMVPLPGRIAAMMRGPLREICTKVSVYLLQTFGVPAVVQGGGGNIIVLPGGIRLGVVEACSGIKMLMLFFAACIGAALIIRRDAVTKVIVVLSAVPIAIIANVLRITVTALLYLYVSYELGEKVFHDLAGWFLMPTAIVLLLIELAILGKLFSAPARRSAAPLSMGSVPSGRPRRGGAAPIGMPQVPKRRERKPPEDDSENKPTENE
jgi:exosortase